MRLYELTFLHTSHFNNGMNTISEGVFFQEPISFRDSYKELSAAGSAEYKEKHVQLKEYRVKTKVLEKKEFFFHKIFPPIVYCTRYVCFLCTKDFGA